MVLLRFGWFFLASSHIICAATKSPGSNPALSPRDSTACPQQGNRDITAYKENIWKSIPQSERTSLQSYIQTWADQNILRVAGKGVRLEYIDLVYPNKSDALVYLEGNGPKPPRYASFNLVFDEDEHSSTHQKFSIGPLPLTPNITIVQPMDWDATSSTGGKIVQANDESAVSFEDLMKTILPEMEDILEDLVGPGVSSRGATFLKQEAGAMWVRKVDPLLDENMLILSVWPPWWLGPRQWGRGLSSSAGSLLQDRYECFVN